jgi:CheY-like chemotaxis protein
MPIADFLREKSYRVIEAPNAAEAMAILQAGEQVEVVFSDVFMPGEMNGIALARWIRQKYADIRVILASGAAVAEDILPGDTDAPLLAKPYDFSDVAEKIRRLTTI